MSSHQVNQANPQITGTYQYQFGDSVVEIPSNINYQLENVISSGGVQYILPDGSILVQKESKKDSNKNSYRRMIVVNQQDLQQATTIQVPTQQRIITQQTTSNGNVEQKNIVATTSSALHRTQQAITPIGPLTLTAEEYNELLQRRVERQAQAEAQAHAEAQQRAQQEAQAQAQAQAQQQRALQDAQRRAQQNQQIHNQQQQMQDHQNIQVQVQKIVQSLEEEVDDKKEDHDDIEMQLIAPKLEVTDVIQTHVQIEGTSAEQPQSKHGTEGKSAAGRPFSCEQCGKKFLLKHHLTTHARVHTGERPHVCIHCGKDFAHKHCLNTHLLLHSTERPYQCTECKKCFTLKHHLLTHSRVHSRDRPFVCTDCGKTFSLKRHLVTHMKYHAGERPYVCDTCGESFAQEQHLVMHSRFHGSLDPFVCPDCGASFPRKFQLVNHGKLHGRVPHECSVCGQEFLQKRTLVAHMRQHTDAPHACLTCGEGFRTKSELTAHQRIVHNIQPPVRVKNPSATATSNNQSIHESEIEQHSQEIDEQQYMKQEHQQFETIQTIQEQPQQSQSYQTVTMVSAGSPSSGEHKTIRIQQHSQQNIHTQNQHVCQQCGNCFNNREALQLHLRLHTGDKSLMTDLQLLTSAIPGHIFQSQGNTYIEIDGGKYLISDSNLNGATLVSNSGGNGSPVPVQIITSANGQQVIEQVQSISPSMLHQHQSQQEVQISQQAPIVYTTVASQDHESPVGSIQIVQQNQVQPQTQQSQVIVHHQPHQPKPKTHFCQHCNKGFAAKHGLQLHNKRHPNGECTVRSHICGECNRAFFQKNHLMLHQRQHMEHQRTSLPVQAEQDSVKIEGEEIMTISESQNLTEESNDNQSIEMRQQNVIISSSDGKTRPQDEDASAGVEATVGQIE